MIDFATAFFLGTFFVTALFLSVMIADIANSLKHIKDDLREHHISEGRRWSIDRVDEAMEKHEKVDAEEEGE